MPTKEKNMKSINKYEALTSIPLIILASVVSSGHGILIWFIGLFIALSIISLIYRQFVWPYNTVKKKFIVANVVWVIVQISTIILASEYSRYINGYSYKWP